METLVKIAGGLIVAAGIALLVALLIALPVMCLWDAVMPDLFGLKTITWTQALWLALLCSLLFKTSTSKDSR